MKTKYAVENIYKWHKIMTVLCIVFAVITVLLFLETSYKRYTDAYSGAIARFWASFALTVFFGIISVTVKKLHETLLLITGRASTGKASESEPEDSIAQQKCPQCGTLHDMDYPKCPFCKYNY